MRSASSTNASSTQTVASATELLPWIDPTLLSPRVQRTMLDFGPFLARGLTLKEIGASFDRSADWASARVQEVREAILDQAVEHLDELPARLRVLVEELRPGSTTAPPTAGRT